MEQETRGRRRQVDIFNFSFLDILACVIGLLIFILTIVVISGGGSSSPQRAAQVAHADHQLADARATAALAQDRRARAEVMLGQRADQANNPVNAAATVRNEAATFTAESRTLATATARLDTRLAQLLPAMDVQKKRAADTVARAQAAAAQSQEMEQRAAAAEAQEAQARAQKKPAREVRYYIPRVRESSRTPVLLEMAGDRIWFLDSEDYQRTRLDIRTSRLDRRDAAPGTSVSAVVEGSATLPDAVTSMAAEKLVFSIAVRPNGFAAFRKFRDWAWGRGYAVNWKPFEASAVIFVSSGNQVYEQ